MRVGTIISVPNEYSRFARIRDEQGIAYTLEAHKAPEDIEVDDELAYKVELWGNDSGLVTESEYE